jgi:flagellar biosynthesis regulator FlaF
MAVQVMNAQAEAQQTRSRITAAWFFSRVYVWLTIAIGIVVLLVLFGKYL